MWITGIDAMKATSAASTLKVVCRVSPFTAANTSSPSQNLSCLFLQSASVGLVVAVAVAADSHW